MNNELIIKNQEELDNIIKGGGCNSRIFIEFGTFAHKAMLNNIKSPVYVCGDYYIEAHGDASIEAYGRAHVSAYDNVSVEAYDKTIVEAHGNAHINAHGNACVEAYDNAVIKAYDDSSVESFNRASVYAYNNSHAKTYDHSHVYAYDNSFIIGYRKSLIDAYDNASVEAYDNAHITAHDESTIVGYNEVSIFASGTSKDVSIVAFDNVSVDAYTNASVEAFDVAHIEIYHDCVAKAHDCVYVKVADNASVEAYGSTSIEALNENVSVKAYANSRVYDLAGCKKIELNDFASVTTPPKDLKGYASFKGIKATSESSFIAYLYAIKGDDGGYYSPSSNPHVFDIGDRVTTAVKNLSGALCDYQRDWHDCAIIEVEVDKSSIGDRYMRFPVTILREIPLEECGALGKIILEKKKRDLLIGDEEDY